MNQPMNPALIRQIQEAMAAGRPLPPGVTAVPHGQQPPPGAVPIPMGPNGAAAPQPSRLQANPIPDGPEGLKIVRNFASCAIAEEAPKLHKLLNAMAGVIGDPETSDGQTIDAIISKGLTAAVRANNYCAQNKQARTVVNFQDDEELNNIHTEIQKEQETMDRLNLELQECVDRGNKLLQERWDKSVSKYGLNPEKYFYHIDEEARRIELVDLDCTVCKGATIIRKARQEATEIMMHSTTTKVTP